MIARRQSPDATIRDAARHLTSEGAWAALDDASIAELLRAGRARLRERAARIVAMAWQGNDTGWGGGRDGAGRPSVGSGDPVQLSIRLGQDDVDRIQALADDQEITRANALRMVIAAGLEQLGY